MGELSMTEAEMRLSTIRESALVLAGARRGLAGLAEGDPRRQGLGRIEVLSEERLASAEPAFDALEAENKTLGAAARLRWLEGAEWKQVASSLDLSLRTTYRLREAAIAWFAALWGLDEGGGR